MNAELKRERECFFIVLPDYLSNAKLDSHYKERFAKLKAVFEG